MQSFIQQIIQEINNKNLDYKNVVIIVPSERMIAYFHAAIFEHSGKPVLSPQIISIDKWVQKNVPYSVVEKTQLLFDLYQVFQKNPVNNEEMGFDKFLTWAQMLLSDFDEIDRYCIDAKQLFKNLRDIRELENWSFNSTELSVGQQQFMAFWDKLGNYYSELTKLLEEKQVVTKGKAYKFLSENINLITKENPNIHIVFAGFNALSVSELSIIKQLYNYGKASVFIDSDRFYFDDKIHEAGRFHRELCECLEVKDLPFIEDNLQHKKLSIQLVECPQITVQAQVIGSELLKLNSQQLNETLVLLADETLLSSVVRHLPAQIGTANITVGLPLKNTALRSWVDLIFKIQESILKKKNGVIYYKDYTQLIHHPFVLGILTDADKQKLQTSERKLIADKRFYFSLKNISSNDCFNSLLKLLYIPWNHKWNVALQTIQQINELFDVNFQQDNELEKAIIQRFANSIVSFKNTISSQELPEMTLSTFKLLLQSQWSNSTVAYYGNPIDGLQIMGLLETRGLDFKNIFVIGMNEGAMPPQNTINSLIPMDLRRYFNLPTPREKQGLFAHHFYRLTHKAENIFITYAKTAEVVGSNEPSRYIQQISLELAKCNSNIDITQQYYLSENKENIDEMSIEKTPEVLQKIKKLLSNDLSYSMLSAYFSCPLEFYFKYIVGIKDEKEVEENIQKNTFGTIVHYILEKLYLPFYDKEKKITKGQIFPADIDKMKIEVPKLTEEAFKKFFSDDSESWQTGENHINYQVAKEYVFKFLDKDKQQLIDYPEKALFINGLEEKLETEFSITTDDFPDGLKIKIKGICDRIDQYDGDHRIIDIKTGKAKGKSFSLKGADSETDFFDRLHAKYSEDDYKFYMQLLFYCYLYIKGKNVLPKAGIFSMVNMKESPFFIELPDFINKDNLPQLFERTIEHIVNDIMNKSIPFQHTREAKYCSNCLVVDSSEF